MYFNLFALKAFSEKGFNDVLEHIVLFLDNISNKHNRCLGRKLL
jgi:hypothetical protein